MTDKKIRWGMLGTSPISKTIAEAIKYSITSKLIAIGSRTKTNGEYFANQFAVPKIYNNYHHLLQDPEIDAVYIGLPNHLHHQWIIAAARAGKHVLCEKPFVISIDEAHNVVKIIKETNIFCMEALMYRFHPFIKKIQNIVNEGALGHIQFYNALYNASIANVANPTAGGSIRNLGCYPVSLIRLLAQQEPSEIHALGNINLVTLNEHQASLILKFANHELATISTSDNIKMSWHFEIFGTQGRLKVITNPWLPQKHSSAVLQRYDSDDSTEINVTADKGLYTYQIDYMNSQILQGDFKSSLGHQLAHSLGNAVVLETWRKKAHQQVKPIGQCA